MLVTPDDFVWLKERILNDHPRLGNAYCLHIFEKLVASVEPRLVITEPGGAAEWQEAVILATHAIGEGSRGLSPAMLDRIARLATKYLKVVGPEPQRRFAFMQAADLRIVAEADWTRLIAAAQREEAKTAAITAGSVVEAIALDVLERGVVDTNKLRETLNVLPAADRLNLRPAKGAPSSWPFAFLLLAIGPRGLQVLSERTHEIGHKLRDWRNFVHPTLARSEPPMTAADGRLAAGFAEKVIEEVEAWADAGATLPAGIAKQDVHH